MKASRAQGLATFTIAALMIASWPAAGAAESDVAARLQRLEDREQILELLTAYGATLDRHDFAAFGQLFAQDASYGSGPNAARGRAAIQSMLQKQILANPLKLPPPNYHLFFNPSIRIEGDRATAHSKGAYVAPDPERRITNMVFFVTYDDVLVRQGGRWLFQQRVLNAAGSAPAASAPAPAR
jgi:hypothetical protein